jgi:hypothetical protein
MNVHPIFPYENCGVGAGAEQNRISLILYYTV